MFNFEKEYRGFIQKHYFKGKYISYVKDYEDFEIIINLVYSEKEELYRIICKKDFKNSKEVFDSEFKLYKVDEFKLYSEAEESYRKMIQNNSFKLMIGP